MKRRSIWVAGAVLALVAVVALFAMRAGSDSDPEPTGSESAATPQSIARGAYLVRIGNCGACHTERGGAPFAGGRAIETPFGTV